MLVSRLGPPASPAMQQTFAAVQDELRSAKT
jgi:hypothetical protein